VHPFHNTYILIPSLPLLLFLLLRSYRHTNNPLRHSIAQRPDSIIWKVQRQILPPLHLHRRSVNEQESTTIPTMWTLAHREVLFAPLVYGHAIRQLMRRCAVVSTSFSLLSFSVLCPRQTWKLRRTASMSSLLTSTFSPSLLSFLLILLPHKR